MATTKKPAGKKKTAAKQAATTTKKVAKAEAKRPANAGLMKPMTPSDTLAAVVGAKALPRTEVVKKLWGYIKQHELQDATDKRLINADEKLREIFGKGQVSMFEMNKLISRHLK